MDNVEIAARLLVLERRAHDLVTDIQVLFQDVLDDVDDDVVE